MRIALLAAAAGLAASALAQSTPAPPSAVPASGNAPIYHVTVVQRTIKAVNYLYRQGPTQIDFRGTVLLPQGKGGATVESKKGRTEIDADFEHLKSPQSYGREYLTYVLWAITPEGRPHNLGEVIPDHSDNGHLHVTTDLQAFAMIVTAEPYSAVRQPSDVVVLENHLRPDTEGSTEAVNAKYELLPRGEYTWNLSSSLAAEIANSPKVSQKEFDTLTELYQAENAVGVAGSAGAAQYAPETYARAQSLLSQAEQMQAAQHQSHAVRAPAHTIIELARQASQTAEDARLIAVDRKQQATLSTVQASENQARQQAANAQQAIQQAQAAAQRAQQDAQAANERANALQKQADADHSALLQAQSQAAQARQRQQQAEAAAQAQAQPARDAARKSALRVRLLEDLNAVMPTMDTPRGLVVTIPDSEFSGDSVRGEAAEHIARIAGIISSQPGLRVNVEGYSDTAAKQPQSEQRAYAVRRSLSNSGLSAAYISAKGLGDSRPLGPAGEAENTRVEIVISGDPIGSLPFWDRTYSLSSVTEQQ